MQVCYGQHKLTYTQEDYKRLSHPQLCVKGEKKNRFQSDLTFEGIYGTLHALISPAKLYLDLHHWR